MEQARNDIRDFYSQNKGYCFLTYSHSDEAKKAMIISGEVILGDRAVEVAIKKNVDHGDFDASFIKARMKADASMMRIKDDLNEAK